MTAKAMLECGINSAIVTVDRKTHGILTSRDILMRVIARGLPPDSTLVEKVMTPKPQCATIDTTIVDALHIMHDGKFVHLPVVDKARVLSIWLLKRRRILKVGRRLNSTLNLTLELMIG